MKTVKFFDIHDTDVTPGIYTLLFSDALIELRGNDLIYEYVFDWQDNFEDNEYYLKQGGEKYQARLARGPNNCYFDHEKMKAFCANPPPFKEVLKEFSDWLKAKGVQDGEQVFIKVWW